jgi:hypothetical protein
MESGKENSGNIRAHSPYEVSRFPKYYRISAMFFTPYGKKLRFVEDTDPFHQTPKKI